MSKELEYEINNFANLLHKDCMNLMECLKKQSEDNKPILYLGKHYEKVILPLEEYQKMCNRLEAIDNANPSEALNGLEFICKILNEKRIDVKWLFKKDYNTIKQALLQGQKEHRALEIIKEKRVACDLLTNPDVMDYKKYNSHCDKYDFIVPLTEEEFNLLKEVVE